MFCEKCGSQITEGATFCNVCGNQINHEHSTYKKNRKSKPKIIAIIAICVVIVATAIAVPVSISSCKKDTSLEGMLTAHKWVREIRESTGHVDSFAINFNKDGTYTVTYDGDYHTDWKGNWKIEYANFENQQITRLRLINEMKNYKYEGWKKSDQHENHYFNTTFTDSEFDKYLDPNISEEEKINEWDKLEHKYYDWYVSEKYLVISGYYSDWRIYVPE